MQYYTINHYSSFFMSSFARLTRTLFHYSLRTMNNFQTFYFFLTSLQFYGITTQFDKRGDGSLMVKYYRCQWIGTHLTTPEESQVGNQVYGKEENGALRTGLKYSYNILSVGILFFIILRWSFIVVPICHIRNNISIYSHN